MQNFPADKEFSGSKDFQNIKPDMKKLSIPQGHLLVKSMIASYKEQ